MSNRYTRSGAAYSKDRKPTICVIVFVIIICSGFFIAIGGLDMLFPVIEDPKQSQLYRMYAFIEPKNGNFSEDFFMEVTIFNVSIIADKFSIAGSANTTLASGNGNLLWSLNSLDEVVAEIESTIPTDMGFHWFDTIDTDTALELSPAERNMYQWIYEYGLYWIKIQLGPRFNSTAG